MTLTEKALAICLTEWAHREAPGGWRPWPRVKGGCRWQRVGRWDASDWVEHAETLHARWLRETQRKVAA